MVAEYSTESFQRDRRCLGNVAMHRREADEVEPAIERVVSWRSCRRRAHVAPSGIGMISARQVFSGEIKALSLHSRFESDPQLRGLEAAGAAAKPGHPGRSNRTAKPQTEPNILAPLWATSGTNTTRCAS